MGGDTAYRESGNDPRRRRALACRIEGAKSGSWAVALQSAKGCGLVAGLDGLCQALIAVEELQARRDYLFYGVYSGRQNLVRDDFVGVLG
jgi:hypothetical protein